MADKSAIEWTDATWNPTTGCTQIPGPRGGPSGCDNCYAKTLIDLRQSKNPKSPRYGKPFETVMLHESRLTQPLRWKRPRRIFVNSLSDVFHPDVPEDFIAQIFDVMVSAHWHAFQVLTKRPDRMRRIAPTTPASNIWLGASVCSNDDAWRADALRATPAVIRFLSVEPLLGPVDRVDLDGIDWLIAGGESGKGARPMNTAWVRDLRDRCVARNIPFFFKQWGGAVDKRGHGDAVLDGRRWMECPRIDPSEAMNR